MPADTNVAFIHQGGGLYGIERMLLALLPEIRRLAYRVSFISLSSSQGPGAQLGLELKRLGIEVHFVPVPRHVGIAALGRILTLLQTIKPDLIHVHGYKAAVTIGLVRSVRRYSVIATVHSESSSARGMKWALAAEAFFYRRFNRIIAVSQGVRRDLIDRGVDESCLSVVFNGIEDPLLQDENKVDRARFIIVGRLVQGKRVDSSIRAIAALVAEGYDCSLSVVGGGPLQDSLVELARELRLADRVHFTGFIHDVRPCLNAASVFLMPSESEGAPMALIEAMACRCAIVASRVGGIPDIVRDGIEAILVTPGDDTALLAAMRHLLDSEELRERLSRHARQRFLEGFEASRMARRYAQEYEKTLHLAPHEKA